MAATAEVKGPRATKSTTSLHPEQRRSNDGTEVPPLYRQQSRDQKLGTDSDPCWWWGLGLVLRQRTKTQRRAPRKGGAASPGSEERLRYRERSRPRHPG